MALTKVQINLGTSGNLSGSRSLASSSLASRITTAEDELSNTLISSSAQLADDISGSFGSQRVGTSDSPTFNAITVGTATITGTLTAQEVHSEFESASILFTSGSTHFGNSSDDVHEMTGSLNISGSLSVKDGALTVTDNVDFNGDLDVDGTTNLDNTDIDGTLTVDGGNIVFNEDSADQDFRVESNGQTHMLFVDGGNNRVGIGISNPSYPLVVSDGGGLGFEFSPDHSGAGYNMLQNYNRSGTAYVPIYHVATDHRFFNGGTETVTISGSGQVGIGTTQPDAKLKVEEDTHGANVEIKMRAQNDSGAGRTFAITADPDARSITMGEAAQFVIKSNGATSDNVGIGVVPEDTNTNYSCLQVGGNGSILSYRTQGASGEMDINHNVFYNQAGNYTYLSTDEATRYRQGSGKHIWYYAASGTAGNTISFTEAMQIDGSGNFGFGGITPVQKYEFRGDNHNDIMRMYDSANSDNIWILRNEVYSGTSSGRLQLLKGDADGVELNGHNGRSSFILGPLGIGLTGPNVPFHVRKSGNGKAGNIARFAQENDSDSVLMYGRGTGAYGASSADACMAVATMETSGRSINAGGTINASGADYAEYETKRTDCGTIEKGDIVGFDINGLITDKWTNAVTFGIKSTNPSYVGGDTWGVGVSSGSIETERQKVDRIAYSGKVPCNVTGSSVGDYIIPVQVSDGIGGVAKSNPTYDEYRQSIGVVRTFLADGSPIVVVKTL